MTAHVTIDGRCIGPDEPCYLVAEIGASHGGSLDRARELVRTAARVGADAVKLQCYTPDDMCRPGTTVPEGSPWAGRDLYDLYAEAQTPPSWMAPLFAEAREVGITCFATPFHPRHVPLLESLGTPAYKIASFELTWPALLEAVAATRKPVILSTGLATDQEIVRAFDVLAEHGDGQVVALHCVSAYPAPPEAMRLRFVDPDVWWGAPIGLSDHTDDVLTPVVAVSLGACMIERHLKLQGDTTSPDAAFASDPETWRDVVRSVRDAERMIGRGGDYVCGPTEAERGSLVFRRREQPDGTWLRGYVDKGKARAAYQPLPWGRVTQ